MNRTLCATLIDVYHMTLDEIKNLTDFQLKEIYFHERKKSGEIEKKNIERRKKRKERFDKKEELPSELPKDVPVRSMRNPRYKEYFDGFTSLYEMHARGAITTENYNNSLSNIQTKFADLFPKEDKVYKEEVVEKEDYQTNYNIIYTHHMNGILSKEQFDIAVESLKKNIGK